MVFSGSHAAVALRRGYSRTSHPDPLHLVEAEFLAPSIVALRCARRGMVGYVRGLAFSSTAVFQIRREAGRPEAVIAAREGCA